MLHRRAELGGPAVAAKPPEVSFAFDVFRWRGCVVLPFWPCCFFAETKVYEIYTEGTLPKSSDPRKHSANRLDSSFLVKSVQTYRIHSDKAVIPSARTRRRWRKKKIRESPISCLIRLFWLDNVYREKALSILCGGGLK